MKRTQGLSVERGSAVVATLGRARRAASVSCDLDRGVLVSALGTCRFTGPAKGVPRIDLPTLGVDPAAAEDAITRIARMLGAEAALTYYAAASHRRHERFGVSFGRTQKVWALTGWAVTKRGRKVPLGWSGAGNGLARLRDTPALERFVRTLAAADGARRSWKQDAGVVLMPTPAALLLHEAIGHFAEASPNIDRRYRLGYRVASEVFDVVDDPMAPQGPARYRTDDEGVRSFGPTEVVRQGVLVAQLHSLETARAGGVGPTANARAESVWFEPTARISNLVCRPGTTPLAGLLQNLWRGLVVHVLSDGWGLAGRVGARLVLAEEVERGRVTGRFRTGGWIDASVGMLTRAIELGDRSLFAANAMCGKDGQLLCDVGTSAPAMRFEKLAIMA